MSDLSFNIRAKYDEVDDLIRKMYALEEQINKMDSGDAKFASLNAEFAKTKQLVEEKSRVIAEMNANSETEKETFAIKNQTEAYKEQVGTISDLEAYYAEASKLNKELNELEWGSDAYIEKQKELSELFEVWKRLNEEIEGSGEVYHIENTTKSIRNLGEAVEETTEKKRELKTASEVAEEVELLEGQVEEYSHFQKTLERVTGTIEQNSQIVGMHQKRLAETRAELRELNNAEKEGLPLSEEHYVRKGRLIETEARYKERLAETSKALRIQVKAQQSNLNSMEEGASSLEHLQMAYKRLTEEEQNSSFGVELQKRIEALDVKMQGLNDTIGVDSNQGMSRAFQRIGMSLPTMSRGMGSFIRSLTSALPRLAQEIKTAQLEYKALNAVGEKGTPVWKQIIKSMFSVQTAIMGAIALIVMYKDEITALFNRTSEAEKVQKAFIESLKSGTSALGKGFESLNRMEGIINGVEKGYVTMEQALAEYNKTLGETMGEELEYDSMKKTIASNKEAYINYLIQEARANAYLASTIELATKAEAIRQEKTSKWKRFGYNVLNALSKGGVGSAGGAYQTTAPTLSVDEMIEEDKQRKIENLEAEIEELKAKYLEEFDKQLELGAEFDFITLGDPKDKIKEVKEGYEKIGEALKREKEKLSRMLEKLDDDEARRNISNIDNELERSLALIAYNEKNEIEALKEAKLAVMEARKEALIEEGKDTNVPLLTEDEIKEVEEGLAQINAKAENERKKANEKALKDDQAHWNKYIQEFGNYQEKRLSIINEYNEKIAGAEGGAKALLEMELKEALSELDFANVKEGLNFTEIFSNIDEKSTGAIKVLRDKLAKYLEEASKDLNPEQVKVLVDALEKMDAVTASRNPFKRLSDSIKAYRDEAKKGEKSTADLGGMLLRIADDAKAVTAEIGDYASMLTPVLDAFGAGELGEDIGSVLDMVGGVAEVGGGVAKVFSGDVIGGIKDMASGVATFVTSLVAMGDRKHERRIQEMQKQIERLDKAYSDLGDKVEKAFSTDASKLIRQQNTLLKQQKVLIANQIKEEEKKKKTDKAKVQAWKDEIDEINKLIAENEESAVDAIFGQDVQSAINDFAQAYLDAWSSGEDKAKGMKDVVKNMIRNVINEMIKGDLAPTIARFRKMVEGFMVDGVIDEYEEAQLNKLIEAEAKKLDSKYSWADRYIKDEGESQGSASKGVFGKIDQETANALDGRFTDFQMSNREILDQSKTMNLSLASMGAKFDLNNKILDQIRMHNENIEYAVEKIEKAKEYGMRSVLEDIRQGTNTLKGR